VAPVSQCNGPAWSCCDPLPRYASECDTTFPIPRSSFVLTRCCSALRSQERTAKGSFEREIGARDVPVPAPQRKGDPVVVERDEHPRETSLKRWHGCGRFSLGESPRETPRVSTTEGLPCWLHLIEQ
jgi:hypothetical protein